MNKIKRSYGRTLAVLVFCTFPQEGIAQSADTTTYSYDAQGRLTEVKQGNAQTSMRSRYHLDTADNRQRVTVEAGGPMEGADQGECTVSAEGASPVTGAVDVPYSVQVRLGAGCNHPVTVHYATRDGTAYANDHYPPLSGALVFDEPGVKYIRVWGHGTPETYYFMDFTTSHSNVAIQNPYVWITIEYP